MADRSARGCRRWVHGPGDHLPAERFDVMVNPSRRDRNLNCVPELVSVASVLIGGGGASEGDPSRQEPGNPPAPDAHDKCLCRNAVPLRERLLGVSPIVSEARPLHPDSPAW